jgi:hypothetical protein
MGRHVRFSCKMNGWSTRPSGSLSRVMSKPCVRAAGMTDLPMLETGRKMGNPEEPFKGFPSGSCKPAIATIKGEMDTWPVTDARVIPRIEAVIVTCDNAAPATEWDFLSCNNDDPTQVAVLFDSCSQTAPPDAPKQERQIARSVCSKARQLHSRKGRRVHGGFREEAACIARIR